MAKRNYATETAKIRPWKMSVEQIGATRFKDGSLVSKVLHAHVNPSADSLDDRYLCVNHIIDIISDITQSLLY